jgi:hypothetical protein
VAYRNVLAKHRVTVDDQSEAVMELEPRANSRLLR